MRLQRYQRNPISLGVPVTAAATAMTLTNLASSFNALAANNVYSVNATTATVSNVISDGDATVPGVWETTATSLSKGITSAPANTFNGFDGNDEFQIAVTTNIGSNSVAGANVVARGQWRTNPVVTSSANRDRLRIDDNSGTTRTINYTFAAPTVANPNGNLDVSGGLTKGLSPLRRPPTRSTCNRWRRTFSTRVWRRRQIPIRFGTTGTDQLTTALMPEEAASALPSGWYPC